MNLSEATPNEQMEIQLKDNIERLRYITNYSSDMISIHDKQARFLFVSAASRRMLGYEQSEFIGKDVYDFIHQDDHEINKLIYDSLKQIDHNVTTYRMRKADGTYVWFESSLGTIRDDTGGIKEIILVSRDITERKLEEQRLRETNEKLLRMSMIDALTGVYNRRHFDATVESEWRRAIRYSQPLSLILFDIDYFKLFNDLYGHQQGDTCLIEVAKTVQQTLQRPGDLLARYGGEEFAVILPNTDSLGAGHVAEIIRNAVVSIQIPHKGSKANNVVTISVGVSTVTPDPALSPKLWIETADRALYEAKNNGRNQVQIYSS